MATCPDRAIFYSPGVPLCRAGAERRLGPYPPPPGGDSSAEVTGRTGRQSATGGTPRGPPVADRFVPGFAVDLQPLSLAPSTCRFPALLATAATARGMTGLARIERGALFSRLFGDGSRRTRAPESVLGSHAGRSGSARGRSRPS